jgi:hypothetical protein
MWVLETVILDLIPMGFRKEIFNKLLKTIKVSALTFFIRKESNKETLHGFGGEASLAYYFLFLAF